MGIYTMGPHKEVIVELSNLCGIDTFVETGTYKGNTTKWAARNFAKVFTIEKAQPFYDRYHPELDNIDNIKTFFGDSREKLPSIVDQLDASPVLFWLDGHWSGGVTAGESDQCPIIEELQIIKHRRNDIIMIDDARLFLGTHSETLAPDQWPHIFDIAIALENNVSDYFIEIFHDIIFLVPKEKPLIDCLRKWSLLHSKTFEIIKKS